ncbi:hypothetical protein K491DRAFT_492094 [Lophiostoma macrostomum CBS 122681]|uniref:C3H1-type domain-containing protein n=1 Tax=Lophiostoma macrostomum CBS 122681 TaxID=1314788 RepID=A0A6A6T463_9PLEO|nr:hypothetical protein K491DRAFT_492094 [Lophiostoma macrostomum CBS 122681]
MTSPHPTPDLHTLLLFSSHGGVCGCPSFWGLASNPDTPPSTPTTATLLPSPSSTATTVQASPPRVAWHSPAASSSSARSSHRIENGRPTMPIPYTFPTPPGPPKETCFFWYHGVCKRDKACPFEHKAHITWPITVPRGYVHWEVCQLPLCPLRDGLEEIERRICGVKKDEGGRVKEKVKKVKEGDEGKGDAAKAASVAAGVLLDDRQTAIAMLDVNGAGDEAVEHGLDMITLVPTPVSNTAESSASVTEDSITQISHSGTDLRKHRRQKSDNPHSHAQSPPLPSIPQPSLSSTSTPPAALFNPPLGPRSHNASPLCFYWYHQGYCTRFLQRKCSYTHNARSSITQVSRPRYHVFKTHNPECDLPLCPVRLKRVEDAKIREKTSARTEQQERTRMKREREEAAAAISRILHAPLEKTKKIRHNEKDKRLAEKNGETFVPQKMTRDAARRAGHARAKRKALAREALETGKTVKPVPRTLEYGPPT